VPDEQNPDDDKFRPEAIAARVEQIGHEDETERIAREEEQKLLQRRKEQKKSGLQTAASKRLARIGEAAVKRPVGPAYAVGQGDPLIDRLGRVNSWIREHQAAFAAVIGVAVLVVGGIAGWVVWENRRNSEASVKLALGFADEHGHITTKDADDQDDNAAKQLYPSFKSIADRRAAALGHYREVETKFGGTGAAILARLAEGGLLLDEGDAKGAQAAYQDVVASALGKADPVVRGRAFEGIGFADERLAESDPPGKDAHLDAALRAFKQLEEVDANGFKDLGMYHQARVREAKGDKAKAIEILKDLDKRITSGEKHELGYLQFVTEDRLRDLDPTALPPKPSKDALGGGARGGGARGGGNGSNIDMNDPKIQEILRQIQAGKSGGGPTNPVPPVAPPVDPTQ
jgi:hypothetical protein